MKANYWIKYFELITLMSAILCIAIYFKVESNWHWIGLFGFGLMGFMWSLPDWIQCNIRSWKLDIDLSKIKGRR